MISPDVNPEAVQIAVLESWNRLKDERVDKESRWQECLLAYDSRHGKGYAEVSQYKSRRYLPLSFEAAENVSSHLTQGIMPHDEWFQMMGRTPDDEKAAKAMAALMKWQHYRTGFRAKVALLMKQACIFGSVPWAVHWKQDYTYSADMEGHADNMAAYFAQQHLGQQGPPPQVPMQPKRIYDGPCLEVGNIFDYVQERHHLDVGYPLRIVRQTCSIEYLKQEAIKNNFGWSKYENIEDIRESNTSNLEASDSLKRQIELANGIADMPTDGVELLIAMGDIPLKGNGENAVLRNHICVIANRSTLIRCEPSPYAHGKSAWQLFSLVPDPLDLYGKGILESALGIQDLANVRWNQVIEANHRNINQEFVAVLDGIFDVDQFVSAPGAVHQVAQQGNLQALRAQVDVSSGFSELGFLKSEFNEATNAMKAFTTADYQKSATEISAIQGMMNSRFSEMIRHIETTFLIPCLQMQCDLNQQFMDEETWIRVIEPQQQMPALDPMGQPMPVPLYESMGPAPMKIAPEDIQGDLDIYPVGAQWIANQQQQVGQLTQWGQMMGAIPPAQAAIDWIEFGRVCAEKMQIRDSWRFIKSPQRVAYEQFQQYQQQLAMQAAEASGQQGGPSEQGGDSSGASASGGNGGVQSMAGTAQPGSAPASPGGQSSMGGPQTM
jgi:hypothetical protein